MKVFRTRAEWSEFRKILDPATKLGFVPTMGALHAGHVSLLTAAKQQTDQTVLSIFVNPTQFNQKEDFDKYPRTLEADLAIAEIAGVDYVFAPTNPGEIYPGGDDFRVLETQDSKILEGAFRPGHFEGMLTVVLKLLRIVQPTHSFFGEKDFQQLLLVKKLTRDFFLETEIIPVPTVREPTGLAMSSRNVRLSSEDHARAAAIYRVLTTAPDVERGKLALEKEGFKVEYLAESWGRRLFAGVLGGVRLIDNVDLSEVKRGV